MSRQSPFDSRTESNGATWPRLEETRAVVFDFDGVFTDNTVYVIEDGRETVRCDRGDGLGVELLRRIRDRDGLDLQLLIISKERNPVAHVRARKLGIECIHAVDDKLAALRERFAQRAPGEDVLARTVYLGNDINDVPVMRRCGFSAAPADAHPLAKRHATVIMRERGGHGFVRAAIEQLLRIDEWPVDDIEALFLTEPAR